MWGVVGSSSGWGVLLCELQVFSEPSQATCLLFANPLRALRESFASSPTVPHKLASDSCISHSRVSLEGIFESSAKSSTVQSLCKSCLADPLRVLGEPPWVLSESYVCEFPVNPPAGLEESSVGAL